MKQFNITKKPGAKPILPKGDYGFVIGNGTSRKGLPLKPLMNYGILAACNWFFRDEFRPHILVASDEPITQTILKTQPNYPKVNWFVTWFPKPGSGAKKASCPEKFAAGPMATEYLCNIYETKKVFLIGVDFFGFGSNDKMNNGKINNLYAGKKHYVKDENTVAPTYRNWQRRFEWIVRNYPDTDFYHVNPFEGKSPERLRGFPNFHQISFENLMDHLENDAELVDFLEKTSEDIEFIQSINEDDVRAVIERQFSGQENVIYKDIIPDDEILKTRVEMTDYVRKNPSLLKGEGAAFVKIIGFDIMVQPFTVQEGNIQRLATPEEILKIHNELKAERSKLTEEKRAQGVRGIKIKIMGMPEERKEPQNSLPVPPPPPGSGFMDLPPPPPPPSF